MTKNERAIIIKALDDAVDKLGKLHPCAAFRYEDFGAIDAAMRNARSFLAKEALSDGIFIEPKDRASIPTTTLLAMLRLLRETSNYGFDDHDRSVIAEIGRRVILAEQIVLADKPDVCDTTREEEEPARIMTCPDTAGMP